MLFNICIMVYDIPSVIETFPLDIWLREYRKHIIRSGDIEDPETDDTPVSQEDKDERAGACLQNALRTMLALKKEGVPEDEIRAIYFINIDDDRIPTFLYMPNDETLRDEEIDPTIVDPETEDPGIQSMRYHVTVVHKPQNTKLRDSQVFDLTTNSDYWGMHLDEFGEHAFFADDDLMNSNKRVRGYVMSIDQVEKLNSLLMSNSKFNTDVLDDNSLGKISLLKLVQS